MADGHNLPDLTIAPSFKIPPYWAPEMVPAKSYETWLREVLRWSVVTELNENQKGVAVSMRLGGAAKAFIDLMELDEQVNGRLLDMTAKGSSG